MSWSGLKEWKGNNGWKKEGRKEGFVHYRLPGEDNNFQCKILKRTKKNKKEKGSKAEYKIDLDKRGWKIIRFRGKRKIVG